MAVTQDEERANKISKDMIMDIEMKVDGLYKGAYGKLRTKTLYKNTDDGLSTTYYEVHPDAWKDHNVPYIPDRSEDLIITRVTSTQRYQSKLTGTATKKPGDRLATDLKRRITKDLRNAWCENEQDAMNTSADSLQKPMLLYKWQKQKKKIKYPCFVQPKHDGVRAIYDGLLCKFYSRSGKVIDLPHLTEALRKYGSCSLDGEICFDDFTVPLPEVIEAISRKDTNLRFHVFDNIEMNDKPFVDRFVRRLKGWFEEDSLSSVDGIRITKTMALNSEAQVDAYYEEATQAGMEGIVVRNADSPYEFGRRTMYTLKYKFEILAYFDIEGYQVIPHPEGDLMQFICKTAEGKQFEVVPAWTHNERRQCREYLELLGYTPKIPLKVEYRGITPDGIPYHAVGKTKFNQLMEDMQNA